MLKLTIAAAALLRLRCPPLRPADPSSAASTGWWRSTPAPPERDCEGKSDIRLMREAGIRWDRIEIWWSVVEPEKGKWDFEFTDRVVAFTRTAASARLPSSTTPAHGPKAARRRWGAPGVRTGMQRR